MTELTPLSPSPDDGAPQAKALPESAEADPKRKRRAGQILTKDQILRGLSQLPGLTGTGLLKPQIANSIRSTYQVLLNHHERAGRSGTAAAELGPEQLAAIRDNPALQQLLEPFMTDEQIASIFEEPSDEPET